MFCFDQKHLSNISFCICQPQQLHYFPFLAFPVTCYEKGKQANWQTFKYISEVSYLRHLGKLLGFPQLFLA